MSIDSDFDADALITLLAGPLPPHLVAAFHRAAEDAIARASCGNEAAVYRAVIALQRKFFDPPTFGRAQWDIGQERPSKLKSSPPLERRGSGRVVRYRKR
jgi:hypothetical protein